MDVAFLLRAQRLLSERQPARLDHAMLLAALAAQQSASQAARARRLALEPPRHGCDDDPLIELVLAGPEWRRAACAQRGCFNRAESRRRVNGS